MDTPLNAFKRIKLHLEIGGHSTVLHSEISIVQHILERAEPKIVKKDWDECGNYYYCPHCEESLEEKEQAYCSYCGQALEWNED